MIRLRAVDGDADFSIGQGALMGDSTAPEDFETVYEEGLGRWMEEMRSRPGGRHLFSHCPILEESVDLSLTTFADDLVIKHLAQTAEEAQKQLEVCNESLTRCIGKNGHSQNQSKQVVVPTFVSKRESHKFWKSEAEGEIAPDARNLGGRFAYNLSNAPERAVRVLAARTAFAQLRGFWFSKGSPWKFIRLTYISKVQSALLSGLEAYVLN